MSQTGLTTLQLLLSKAKVCGVKRFLVASVPIPVTHMQCSPIAGCLQRRWDQGCHSNDPAEASRLWLGRAGRGWKVQQGQEWDWKIETGQRAWPALPMGWCGTSAMGGRGCGVGEKTGEPPPHFPAEQPSRPRGLRTASWGLWECSKLPRMVTGSPGP